MPSFKPTHAIVPAIIAGTLSIFPLHAQYGIPEVSPPVCVKYCPEEGGGGESESRGTISFIERLRARAEAAAARRRGQAHEQNEQGVSAFKRGDYKEALRLFRKALRNNPEDTVIRQNVKNAENELDRERKEQKQIEEERQKRAAFHKQNEKMLALMIPVEPRQAAQPQNAVEKAKPPLPVPAGLSEEEYRELRRCEEDVNRLYAKRNAGIGLNDAEAQAFMAALQRRNALWAKAVHEPHSMLERETLRLVLPVSESLRVSAKKIQDFDSPEEEQPAKGTASERDTAITNLLAEHSTDKAQDIIDTKTGKLIKRTMGEKAADRFENLLGISRVATKAREGTPEAGSELVDFIISKFPKPMSSRAELAKDGGKVYSNVVYRALSDFMDKVNQGFGFNIDKNRILKDQEMTEQQKAVRVWTGYGE